MTKKLFIIPSTTFTNSEIRFKKLIIPPTISLKNIGKGLSVESVRNVLNELVELGYGDYELKINCNSDSGYTGFTEKIYIDEKEKNIDVMQNDV